MKVGDVFYRLTVVDLIPDKKNPKADCICVCGNRVQPQRGALMNGRAKSCGCHRREQLAIAGRKHGLSKSREYSVFRGMNDRCRNPNNPHYRNYGGRGLDVLYQSFQEFLDDVGLRPDGAWIERIDNSKGYEPGNCKWVSPKENQINKRVSKFWLINGRRYESSVEAAKALGVTPSVIIRGCNGYRRHGRYYPPREGWTCFLKYQPNDRD